VLDLAEPVLKHRMALTFSARAEGRTIPDVIRQLKTRIGWMAAETKHANGEILAIRRAMAKAVRSPVAAPSRA